MAANQYERHGKGRARLKALFGNPENVLITHYSCESFYDLPDGRSPRITSIALRNLATGQTESFSIHQVAEINGIGVASDAIGPHYNQLERTMLDQFFDYLKNNISKTFLHWNMRDKNYGFQAIEHRYKVLGGTPIVIAEDRKVDLSRLLIDLYGVGYIGHPRLETLLAFNNITSRDFMTGAQEAEAFESGKYVDLHRSTLRKVDVFANLAQRAFDKSLKTNATWKEAHGLSWKTALYLLKRHWIYPTIVIGGSIVAAIYKVASAIWGS